MKNKTYLWSGLTATHNKIHGEILALSINFAKAHLMQQGIEITTLKKKPFQLIKQKITSYDLAIFFRQLATLISAGIPLSESCETLRSTQENPTLQLLTQVLQKELQAGQGFANTLKKFPQHFNNFTCGLIYAGEQSGKLEHMLNRIAAYQEKTLALKKQIQQALFYPALISVVALAVTFIMLIIVVPKFEELFQTMHGTLPTFTLMVMSISNYLRNNAWLILLPFIAASIFSYYLKTSRPLIDHLFLKTPFISRLLQKIIFARFARSFATLLSAGIPITDAMTMSAQTCGNHTYLKAINQLKNQITSGQSLHAAMQNNKLFPILPIQMIKIGEETGSLPKMLDKIAELYESDINHLINHLSRLLEPLIMVVLGVLIGGLVIAMYLPIFKLGTVI